MVQSHRTFALLAVLLTTLSVTLPRLAAADQPAVGATTIARWQDNRTAAFLLMFDDSWPSHWQVAAPELVSRGMIATFYLNPGKGEFQKYHDKWEGDLLKQGMVYGDHTMTHKGVKDLENAEWEIGECARIVAKMQPGPDPHLISYAQPGVAKGAWNITDAQLSELLAKHHLISRPDAKGHMAIYHLKTTEEMIALADKAIAQKGMEYLIIHGVERIKENWGYQDFWALKQDILKPLLDALKERRDKGDLWITDHISEHKYERERDGATVKLIDANEKTIQLELTSTADPKLYDLPLTLITRTPKAWAKAKVTQGARTVSIEVSNGVAQFQAMPNGGTIALEAQ